jgi:hypothetical protein
MGVIKDLTGMVFGRLTVVKLEKLNKHNQAMWLCRCECGNRKIAEGGLLRRGKVISCGCSKITHNLGHNRIYKIWHGMMERCYKPSSTQFHYYGMRGIVVCEEWQDVSNFYLWAMANGYKEDLSIERKDVNGNYEPANCVWIPRPEQAWNRRTTRNVTIDGITKPAAVWAKECGITRYAFYKRLKSGWNGAELLKPLNESKRGRLANKRKDGIYEK